MKKITVKCMPVICACLLTIFSETSSAQIYSTTSGGDWTDPTTWIGGTVPGGADDVVIDGTVSVNSNGASCNNLTVNPGKLLKNRSNSNYTLTVNGDIVNNGSILDDYFHLYLQVYGNISQNGSWTNQYIYLNNPVSQSFIATSAFGVENIVNNEPGNTIYLNSDITLNGTSGNFNDGDIVVAMDDTLSVNGGNLSHANFLNPHFNLNMTANAWIDDCTFSDVTLSGTVLIYHDLVEFNGETVNNGIIKNLSNNNFTVTISGNITNNGTIQDNYYNLYVVSSGNITNNGTWNNDILYLNNPVSQSIMATSAFGCNQIISNHATATYYFNSDITFNNIACDFDSCTLVVSANDSLKLNNSNVYRAYFGNPDFVLDAYSGSWLQACKFNDVTFAGTVQIYGNDNEFNGETTNNGIIQNRSSNNSTLTINGNFTNNGMVRDNNYILLINSNGDLTNNGSWTNNTTTLTGSSDQNLNFNQPFSGQEFFSTAGPGNGVAQSDLIFNGTKINFNFDTLEFAAGTKLSHSADYLRNIVIQKTALPAFQLEETNDAYFQNLTIDAIAGEFLGTCQANSGTNTCLGTTTNKGTLQNDNNNNFTVNLEGPFINDGIIADNYYTLTLNLFDDIENNGTWSNENTNFADSTDQMISATSPFSGANYTVTDTRGVLIAQSGIQFNNAFTNFADDTLRFDAGNMLTIDNGNFRHAVVMNAGTKSNLPFELELKNNAYIRQCSFESDSIYLKGVVRVSTSPVNFVGNTVNYGTLKNLSDGYYSANFIGSLTNRGSIIDDYFTLTVYVTGDIHNHST